MLPPCCRAARHILYMSYLLLGFSFPVLMMGVTIVLAKLMFFGKRRPFPLALCVRVWEVGRAMGRRWSTDPIHGARVA